MQKYGTTPVNIQWNVVRGDTATLRVDFLELDEKTAFNTDGWNYQSAAYDPSGGVVDDLQVTAGDGYVLITAPASVTENWGINFKPIVAELPFDLQVSIPNDNETITWTPVAGTISVLGDVTGSSL